MNSKKTIQHLLVNVSQYWNLLNRNFHKEINIPIFVYAADDTAF